MSNKEVSIGSWLTIGNETVAEIVSSAGYEWVVIDMEHSTISIAEVGRLIRVVDANGPIPIVRVPSLDIAMVKRVLDAGAEGIIFPDIRSAVEAQDAVAASHYPPKGSRGVGLARAQQYGRDFQGYFTEAAPKVKVWIQIESVEAVDNIEAIFKVDGVDGFIIGPYDLSCSLGIPGDFDNEKFQCALNTILSAADRNNVPAGIHVVEPDIEQVKTRIREGYSIIAYSVDIRMIAVAADAGVNI